jgi:hypothetical protein
MSISEPLVRRMDERIYSVIPSLRCHPERGRGICTPLSVRNVFHAEARKDNGGAEASRSGQHRAARAPFLSIDEAQFLLLLPLQFSAPRPSLCASAWNHVAHGAMPGSADPSTGCARSG